jgi:subtilisin-like proprotein convertase family protein
MHDALVIDDNDECTTDSCDSNTGVIEHAAIDIDDSDGCTTDACDSANGNVSHDFCASALCDTTNACLTISDVGTFTHAPSLTIPTTAPPNVVTDTITVSGLGTVLRDVDVTTFITHSFSSDLDVTLQSPAGTIVTLTSDNGAGFDDVFNGTVWNDSADLTNVGNRAADHVYADLTLASPLTPEEPLGAFIGENPNGTWTLTISDDSNLDGGALASWGLDIKTITAAPTVTNQVVTQSAALAIADVTNQSSNVNVPAATGTSICSITVDTNITHTSPVDLVIMLSSPSGTTVTLTSGNGGSTVDAFAGTTWNDDADPSGQVPYAASVNLVTDHTYVAATVATPLTPEEALSAFIGEDPEGTWTLEVDDTIAGDTGTLNSWSLNIGRCMRAP